MPFFNQRWQIDNLNNKPTQKRLKTQNWYENNSKKEERETVRKLDQQSCYGSLLTSPRRLIREVQQSNPSPAETINQLGWAESWALFSIYDN